jgi:F-type H+-transporting ATPase subunit b
MRLFGNRGGGAAVLSVLLPVLSSALPARAEEGGLPQLDTSLFPEELFWLAVTFAVLYVLMAFVALPRVAHTKQQRRHIIGAELEAARKASDEANQAAARVDKLLKEARDAAQTSAQNMIAEVAENTAARQMAQDKELLRRLHSAEASIVVARESALATIRASASSELATAMTEKLLGVARQEAA